MQMNKTKRMWDFPDTENERDVFTQISRLYDIIYAVRKIVDENYDGVHGLTNEIMSELVMSLSVDPPLTQMSVNYAFRLLGLFGVTYEDIK